MSDKHTLNGALNINNARQVRADLQRAVDGGTLSFDLSGLETCDSAGVAMLIEVKKYAQRKNQSITYTNQPEQLQQLAAFLKVDSALFQ